MIQYLKTKEEKIASENLKKSNLFVFDMGNVITKPARIGEMYLRADMQCSTEEFKRLFYHSPKADESYRGIINDDEFFDYIRMMTGSTKTSKNLQYLYRRCKGGIYAEAMQEIQRLKEEGYQVYLLSNLREIDYRCLSEKITMSIFDKMFLSYKLGMSKPHEDIYKYVIDELGTNNFYFFDDSKRNIEKAESLGIQAYQTTGEEIPKWIKVLK